jgi:hypothetical protein
METANYTPFPSTSQTSFAPPVSHAALHAGEALDIHCRPVTVRSFSLFISKRQLGYCKICVVLSTLL